MLLGVVRWADGGRWAWGGLSLCVSVISAPSPQTCVRRILWPVRQSVRFLSAPFVCFVTHIDSTRSGTITNTAHDTTPQQTESRAQGRKRESSNHQHPARGTEDGALARAKDVQPATCTPRQLGAARNCDVNLSSSHVTDSCSYHVSTHDMRAADTRAAPPHTAGLAT